MYARWLALPIVALALAGCVTDPPADSPNTSGMTTSTSSPRPTDSCDAQGNCYPCNDAGQCPSPSATTTTPTTTEPTSPTTTTPVQPVHVHVANGAFDPAASNAAVQTKYVWHGHESGHTVTIHREGDATGTFLVDQSLANGGEVEYTFPSAGTYHVFCRPHSNGETGDYQNGMVSTVTIS